MRDQGAEAAGGRLVLRSIAIATLGLALASLAWRAAQVLGAAVAAIPFPLSLDYGEGIVLQQALMITGPRAYGAITELPFIVFHYPPIYHLVVRAVAAIAGGSDAALVTAGRTVSLLGAIAAAAAVGTLAHSLTVEQLGRGKRVVAGVAAGLLVLGTWPFAFWLPFARVDMLALAFTMAGLALAVRAGQSRVRLHGAVLLFVLAVFTKQTSIAAPAAFVIALLMTDRRRALEVVASGLAVSLLLLGVAQWYTDGGFLRHVVGYNVNRFLPERLLLLVAPLIQHGPMLLAVLIGLLARSADPQQRIDDSPLRTRAWTVVLLHFGLCTIMLALIGKSGSSANYLLEWCCSVAVLAGMALGRAMEGVSAPSRSVLAGPAGAVLIGAALMVQGLLLPDPRHPRLRDPAQVDQVAATMLGLVREANEPPISDDMVLVIRGGKQVPWEPAIFAELASLGRWNEALIIDAIRAGRISMAVTEGARGSYQFDSRYNPAVADAMDAAWPQKARLGWFTLHLPADAPLPPGAVPGLR